MNYDVRGFLFFNELSQKEVADYIGVSKSQMSKLVSGVAELKVEQYEKLLTNDMGWDVKYLTDSPLAKPTPKQPMDDSLVASLRRENDLLKEQLAKAEARASEYWEMIKQEITRK
jgi:transcriptional regulator with XRE-family HTH domain